VEKRNIKGKQHLKMEDSDEVDLIVIKLFARVHN